jgi:hypothetical protein
VRNVLSVGLVLAVAASGPGARAQATSSSSGGSGSSCSDQSALVYVASADSGPVAAYNATATGAVLPRLAIQNPDLANTVWDPWGVTFDARGNLYVQTFLSDATSFVFAQNATGNAPPVRVFRGGGPDTRSIAVDSNGFEYIATGEGASDVLVLAPGASGAPADLYSVNPVNSFQADETAFHPWPSLLAVDGQDDLVAAVVRSSGNAVEFFLPGDAGSAPAFRTITGPTTGLGSCPGGTCDQLALTFSALTNRVYAGVSSGASEAHVSAFAQGASGDAAPLQTIQGAVTGLDGKVVTGIAVSPCTGDIYTMVKGAEFSSPGSVLVFDRLAQGNVAPKRAFTDATSGFADAEGIALTVAGGAVAPASPAWALGSLAFVLVALAAWPFRRGTSRRSSASSV